MNRQTKNLILSLSFALGGFSLAISQEVGLQLYSLRNQFKKDVPGTLKLIRSWGITKIEGGDLYGYSMPAFKSLLKENELEMTCVGASFDDLKNDPQKVVKLAKDFGVSYVMCAWVPHEGDFTLDDAKNAVSVFNKAGKILKEEGIAFAYHPHGYEFGAYNNGTLFDYMVENASSFDFEMDVFWVKQGGADPLALLKKYPEKFILMHLKDRAKGTPNSTNGHAPDETNVVLGTGDVGIGSLVEEAKKLGIKYMYIEDESPDVVDQVPRSLLFLKGVK